MGGYPSLIFLPITFLLVLEDFLEVPEKKKSLGISKSMIFAQVYLGVMNNIYHVPLEFIYLLYFTRLDKSVAFKCAKFQWKWLQGYTWSFLKYCFWTLTEKNQGTKLVWRQVISEGDNLTFCQAILEKNHQCPIITCLIDCRWNKQW